MMTRCRAVTLYKSVTLPPVDQIIIWLPNSIYPYILLESLNLTIIRSKVQIVLGPASETLLPWGNFADIYRLKA